MVYPAGFVYIYSFLYSITDGGNNIHLGTAPSPPSCVAQYIFLGLYLATEAVVMILYHRSKVVPQ